MYEIKVLPDTQWDSFLRFSNQGNIFNTTKWCKLFDDPYKIFGCFKGLELVGGIIGFEESAMMPYQQRPVGMKFISGGYPVTQYQGICVKKGLENKYAITEALLDYLETIYVQMQIINHPTMTDVRPMLWRGWKPLIKYTYVIHPEWDNLEKDTKNEIRGNDKQVTQTSDINKFYNMYWQTFSRKVLPVPVSRLWMFHFAESFAPSIYISDTAAAMIVSDWEKAYYIFGASNGEGNSMKVVWEAIKDYPEVDTVGANDKQIALYKRGLGGILTPFLGGKL